MNTVMTSRLLAIMIMVFIIIVTVLIRVEIVHEAWLKPKQRVYPIFNETPGRDDFVKTYLKRKQRPKTLEKLVFPISDSIVFEQKYVKKSLVTFTDPYVLRKQIKSNTFDKAICKQLKVSGELSITDPRILDVDVKTIEASLNKNPPYKKLINKVKARFKSNLPAKSQWLRFAGSSVWLNNLKIHFMVSRLIFSPSGIPNKGFASFLYIQAFDENWHELTITREIPYEKLATQRIMNLDGTYTNFANNRILASRTLSFPSLLPIEFDYKMKTPNDKYYWGPEDPRILKRFNPTFGFEEPIIVFNLKNEVVAKRVMHLYLPYSNKLTILTKRSEPWAYIEKNWTPFISRNIKDSNKINMIYSFSPLEVLTCDIETGVCDFLQKKNKSNRNYFGPLRGGTQLEAIPLLDYLPKHLAIKFPKKRQVYVGFARTHLNQCGCGESMYRPNFIILVEDYNPTTNKFYYKIADISSFFDFNAVIRKWTIPEVDDNGNLIGQADNKLLCDKSLRNVLIPNSIAYWDIESITIGTVEYERTHFNMIPNEKPKSLLKFNDYMGVTLSAGDIDVSIVHVHGLLDYILNIPSLFDADTYIDTNKKAKVNGTRFNERCSALAAQEYCISYARKNGGVVDYLS